MRMRTRRTSLAIVSLATVGALSFLWAMALLFASTLPWGPDAPAGPHVDAAHRADLVGAALCAGIGVLSLILAGIVAGDRRAVPPRLELGFLLLVLASVGVPAALAGSISAVEVVRCAITLTPLAVIPWRRPVALRASER